MMLSLLGFAVVHADAPTRALPFAANISPDFSTKASLNVNVWGAVTQPVVGDYKVINPYSHFDVREAASSLNDFRVANSLEPVDYLAEPALKKLDDLALCFDYKVDRLATAAGFDGTLVFQDIFEDANMDFTGKFAERNTALLKHTDLFLKSNFSAIDCKATGEFDIAAKMREDEFHPVSGTLSKNSSIDTNQLFSEMEKSRFAIASDLNKLSNLTTGYCKQSGVSDLSFSTGLRKRFHNASKIKHAEVFAGFTVTLPCGTKGDIDNSLSINFGQESTTFGLFAGADVQLRNDIYTGANISYTFGYKNTAIRRIPMGSEPAIFSPLKSKVKLSTGGTVIINPYVTMKNSVMEDLDLKAGFVYIKHYSDSLKDLGNDSGIKSVLNNYQLEKQSSKEKSLREFSAWSAKFFDICAKYRLNAQGDTENDRLAIVLNYQLPLLAEKSIKNHRISIGLSTTF